MSKENGQVQEMEVMPDLDNEIVEPVATTPKSGGCGCNKAKNMAQAMPESENKTNWMRIGMIVGVVILAYFMFKKKGKIEVPTEVPKV